jgi:hypothetical protein
MLNCVCVCFGFVFLQVGVVADVGCCPGDARQKNKNSHTNLHRNVLCDGEAAGFLHEGA